MTTITITIDRAVVEQALEALERQHKDRTAYSRAKQSANATCGEFKESTLSALIESGYMLAMGKQTVESIAALRAALAQEQAEPVQEPYCYIYEYDGVFGLHREFYPRPYNGMKPSRTVPVYTSPPQRKPLTEEEIDRLWHDNGAGITLDRFSSVVRAVERAHGIGEEK